MKVRVFPCLSGAVLGVLVQLAFPSFAAADNVRNAQWHLPFLRIDEAHAISRGTGVSVAIIDTGVDVSHPDLAGSVGVGAEVGGVGDGRTDVDGHGTSMVGLVAARGRGMKGVLGIAPDSLAIPIRISDQQPLSVATGIDQAVMKGVKVICLALTTGSDRDLEAAVARAQNADIVVVAAAGNRPNVGVQAPARYPGVIAAVGVDQAANRASISVTGPEALLAAPAVSIVSSGLSGGYSTGTGTSDSSAIVAGVAALVRSKYPNLTATEVIHRMTATAIDKGDPGRDKEYGYGIVNPVAALTADVPPLSASPSISPAPTGQANSSPKSNSATAQMIGFAILLVGLIVVIGGVVFLSRKSGQKRF